MLEKLEFNMQMRFSNQNVDIGQVTIGRVVQYTRTPGSSRWPNHDDFGHITGFTRNSFDELILLIKFSKLGAPVAIHPTALSFM